MLRSTDPYLRDRLHDLEISVIADAETGRQDHAPSASNCPDNAILIARAMGPARLARL